MNISQQQKRKIIKWSLIAIGIIILFKIGFVDAVLWLIFALLMGFVPGTDLAIPPLVMLIIYVIAGYFLIKWIRRDPVGYKTKGPSSYKGHKVKSQPVKKKRSSKKYARGSTL